METIAFFVQHKGQPNYVSSYILCLAEKKLIMAHYLHHY